MRIAVLCSGHVRFGWERNFHRLYSLLGGHHVDTYCHMMDKTNTRHCFGYYRGIKTCVPVDWSAFCDVIKPTVLVIEDEEKVWTANKELEEKTQELISSLSNFNFTLGWHEKENTYQKCRGLIGQYYKFFKVF